MPKAKKLDRDSPYASEEIDETETDVLDEHMASDEVPEEDDQPGQSTSDEVEPPKAKKPAAQTEEADVEDEADTDEQGDDEPDELGEFLSKHKDKTPEELAKLAFQQTKRAGRAEYDSRQAGQRLQTVLDRINEAKRARIDQLNADREAFKAKVEEDPDAALLEARQTQINREIADAEAAAEREEFNARAEAAVEMASRAIPNFSQRVGAIREFGVDMGFTPDEVGSIVDGRQIVTLYLASLAGNLIKAGVMNVDGRFNSLPVSDDADPAPPLKQPARRTTFGRQPARGAQRAKSLEEQLQDIESMSDEEFDKLDPHVLEGLLREAEQQ